MILSVVRQLHICSVLMKVTVCCPWSVKDPSFMYLQPLWTLLLGYEFNLKDLFPSFSLLLFPVVFCLVVVFSPLCFI